MKESLIQDVTHERLKWEAECLGDYAVKSVDACRQSDTPGQLAGELPDYRNPFAHDADRIIYSHSYARYMDKTQVFFQVKQDHITRRSLHVQMVSRIARTLGRCLKLNEDLIEAIAVGHDIGHTPFGHAGEMAISQNLEGRNAGCFIHNAHSVRVLQKLEHKGAGLDLTLQVLDGILGHNGEITQSVFEYDKRNLTWTSLSNNVEECFRTPGYDKKVGPSTLEGCVVRVSDIISYLGKDFEDAVMLKLVHRDDLPIEVRRVLGTSNRDVIDRLCSDIIENSQNKERLEFSEPVFNAFASFKNFNNERIYKCPFIMEQISRFKRMVDGLFEFYLDDLKKGDSDASIFKDFISHLPDSYLEETSDERVVADYLASMTDQYFMKQYVLRFMPQSVDYEQLDEMERFNRRD